MRRSTGNLFGNPFMAWTDVAWKIGEMSMASAQVIAHRTTRMASAGPLPSARDREEFSRMGQEKVDAASESARAIAAQLTTMQLSFGALAFRQIVTAMGALMALAASRNAGQFIARQAVLAESVTRTALTAVALSDSTARVATHGLKPIHARATANARRLGRR